MRIRLKRLLVLVVPSLLLVAAAYIQWGAVGLPPVSSSPTLLHERFGSRGAADFADKVLSALRYEFGGHVEKAAATTGGA